MKKNIIVYASIHHKNTEKLLNGIAKGHPNHRDIENCISFVKNIV